MSVDIQRLNLFPTVIFDVRSKSPEEENGALLEAIEAEKCADPEGISRSNDPEAGGWHSRTNLHSEPGFAFFAHRVREIGNSIANELGYSSRSKLSIQSMWAIENRPGASNTSHVHPGALWSGVYYVQADEDSGDIEFTDPRTANIMLQPEYAERPESCNISARYNPVPGRFLIFPSWLFHFVHPNRSPRNRVIISYNLGP